MRLTSGQKAVIRAAVEEYLANVVANPSDSFEQNYLLGYIHGASMVLGEIKEHGVSSDLRQVWERAKKVMD